jgi:hypothetical protein
MHWQSRVQSNNRTDSDAHSSCYYLEDSRFKFRLCSSQTAKVVPQALQLVGSYSYCARYERQNLGDSESEVCSLQRDRRSARVRLLLSSYRTAIRHFQPDF